MVTQGSVTSGPLRRSIGKRKQLLNELLSEESTTSSELIPRYDAIELEKAVLGLFDEFERCERNLSALADAENKWAALRRSNPPEQKEHDSYVANYGPYMETYREGELRLQEIVELYRAGYTRLESLDKTRVENLTQPNELILTTPLLTDLTDLKSGHTTPNPRPDAIQTLPTADEKKQRTPTTIASSKEMAPPTPQMAPIQTTSTHMSPTRTPPFDPTRRGMDAQTIDSNMQGVIVVEPNVTVKTSNPWNAGAAASHPQMVLGHNLQMQLQLPAVQLPVFNGDSLKYFEFRQLFDALVTGQAEAAKMHFLRSSLTGEAAELVRTLPVTHASYEIAIDILDQNYGGKLRQKTLLLQKMRNLPDITHTTDPKSLKMFLTQATITFNLLMTLGGDADNSTTADIIMCKLPMRIQIKLYGNSNGENTYLAGDLLHRAGEISRNENLIADLCNRHQDNRNVTTMAAINHINNNRQRHQPCGGRSTPHQQHQQRPQKPCAFCVEVRMVHLPEECRKHPTVTIRKQRAKDLRLCFRCLEQGHGSKQCSASCQGCQGHHHAAICPKREPAAANQARRNDYQSPRNGPPGSGGSGGYAAPTGQSPRGWNQRSTWPQPSNQTTQQPASQDPRRQGHWNGPVNFNQRPQAQTHCVEAMENPTSATFTTQTEITTAPTTEAVEAELSDKEPENVDYDNEEGAGERHPIDATPTKQQIIMQVFDINILDGDGQEHTATVFLDEGSNTSYITKDLVQKLNINSTGTKHLNLTTFQSKKKNMKLRTFDVAFRTETTTKVIQLFEIDTLPNNVCSTVISTNLVNQLLKDPNIRLPRIAKDIDILIGLDTSISLLGEKKSFIFGDLELRVTECGPIISGREPAREPEPAMTFTTMNETTAIDEIPEMEEIRTVISRMSTLEGIGITDTTAPATSKDEESCQRKKHY
ncbi:unnamed protein product [Caenorhabditis sp. 36 PRJEB53466]|nr:unnamed protein product [Caenorhabditis sp. 36 PRJEB53466]